MSDVLPFVVIGLAGGASYSLIALGLVLINNSSRILSFAQGEIGVFGALVVATTVQNVGLSWSVAVPIGVAAGAAAGLALRTILFSRRPAGTLPPLVGTIAALLMLTVLEVRFFRGESGGPVRTFAPPFEGGVRILGVIVTHTQLAVVASVAVICASLWFVIERTRTGLMIRASADNPGAAAVVGLRPGLVESVTWCIAGALAAVGGIFLGWIGHRVGAGFLTYALAGSFTAAILGGMTSLPGAVVAGLVVGLAEALTRYWAGSVAGAAQVVVFAILFLTLLLRPQGLLGRRRAGLATEGAESMVALHSLVRIPRDRLGARRLVPRIVVAICGLLLVGAIVRGIPEIDAFRLSLAPVYVILALSLNSLLASTGQVSLAHGGLLGVGAFMTGVAATTWDFPFALAATVGVLATTAIALGVGVAALRVRGLYLAVLTLSFAVVLESFVFPRPSFSQGGAGLQVSRPRWGPVDLADERTFLAFALMAMSVVWLADRRLQDSPLGRSWVAVRENEVAATARGIPAAPLRVVAFAVSGAGAGIAGALFAYRIGHLVSLLFPLFLSFTIILYVVLGGIGSRVGVAVVTALFTVNAAYGGGGGQNDLALLVGAGIVLFTIGTRPDGLAGMARSVLAKIRAARQRSTAGEPSEEHRGPGPSQNTKNALVRTSGASP